MGSDLYNNLIKYFINISKLYEKYVLMRVVGASHSSDHVSFSAYPIL